MDKIETEIDKLGTKIEAIEDLLDKDYEEWTLKEKQKFGNHEQLRRKEEQLREERKQLRDKEQELLKQQTIILQKQGIYLFPNNNRNRSSNSRTSFKGLAWF